MHRSKNAAKTKQNPGNEKSGSKSTQKKTRRTEYRNWNPSKQEFATPCFIINLPKSTVDNAMPVSFNDCPEERIGAVNYILNTIMDHIAQRKLLTKDILSDLKYIIADYLDRAASNCEEINENWALGIEDPYYDDETGYLEQEEEFGY